MKHLKTIYVLVIAIALMFAVPPVSAQLGTTDSATFTVQNISSETATVSITFYAQDGTEYTPADLGSGTTNPFDLAVGYSKGIDVSTIPLAQLPSGQYSAVISSTAPVIAQVTLLGSGTLHFTGATMGFSQGAHTMYLPVALYNFSGWYSMLTVQNLGTSPADVTVTITCLNGTVGTLTQNAIPAMGSFTWATKNVTPTGFTTSTVCDGSAVVTADQDIVAVNNQNKPGTGATNSLEASSTGGNPVYAAQIQNNYSGWISNLTISKIESGNTTVTVTYSDGDPDDTCNLTDAQPTCKLLSTSQHTKNGRYSGTITASPSKQLIAIVASTKKGTWSGAVSAVSGGTATVYVPNVSKYSFNWQSAINCQVVGGGATTLHVSYAGYEAQAYDTASLAIGASTQIQVFNESFLPNPWQGSAIITANNTSAQVACTVGNSNPTNAGTYAGDWTAQYNAFNK
jgi:hypothetical protein